MVALFMAMRLLYTYSKHKMFTLLLTDAYRDAWAMHSQLAMYVLKQLIHQCLLYIWGYTTTLNEILYNHDYTSSVK